MIIHEPINFTSRPLSRKERLFRRVIAPGLAVAMGAASVALFKGSHEFEFDPDPSNPSSTSSVQRGEGLNHAVGRALEELEDLGFNADVGATKIGNTLSSADPGTTVAEGTEVTVVVDPQGDVRSYTRNPDGSARTTVELTW